MPLQSSDLLPGRHWVWESFKAKEKNSSINDFGKYVMIDTTRNIMIRCGAAENDMIHR